MEYNQVSDYPIHQPSYWQLFKNRSTKKNFVCTSLIALVAIISGVYAIKLGYNENSMQQDCIIELPTFQIKYDMWIKVEGFTCVISTIAITTMLLMAMLKRTPNYKFNYVIKLLMINNLGFQFSWYVVNCVYYFNRNSEDCNSSVPTYVFATYMMFTQPLMLVCVLISYRQFNESDLYHRQPSLERIYIVT